MQSVPSINWWGRLTVALSVIGLIFPQALLSQPTELQLKKFSPPLQKYWRQKRGNQISVFTIAVSQPDAFTKSIETNPAVTVIYQYRPANVFVIKTTWDQLFRSVLPKETVLFIDEQRLPKEELAVSNLDLSVNKVTINFSRFPQYNGIGLTVSVKENRPDTNDIDFHGRYIPTTTSSNVFSTHASIMATIIAGGGNTYYEAKGPAWGSAVSSSSFAVLMPDPDAVYQQYNISVQNHSYGTAIENFYGADAAAYDASVITRPSLIHIFSAGNSGEQTSTSGPYANVAAFANITGSFKMGKNLITVGHTDSLGVVLGPSSRGPAYDGRVKPELVAFAQDGSSGAAAIVSGISLSIQQAYEDQHGALPSAALVKAILLNSADDVGPKGIDFTSGYGAANAYKALLTTINSDHFNGSISSGVTDVFNLTVPPNIKQLKLTLAWNDPPATPNAAKALRNDLDIELSLPATGQLWQPWVLNPFPKTDSLQLLPARKRDSLNNVEQISVDSPAAGNYQIHVTGFNVSFSSPQSYYLAYQFDTLDRFTWYYPTKQDNFFIGRANMFRWQSSYANSTGQLEYSLNGNSWQLIDDAVDLTKGYYKWTPPDSLATAVVRMSFGSQRFLTDTFTISKRLDLFVGFNCADSFMLYWHKAPGVNRYVVYDLGDKYMEPLVQTTDTSIVLDKQSNNSLYYAVAPVINSKTGVRSYGYNYTTQGVTCYVRTFIGQLINSSAKLDLELGSIYGIKTITWQKLTLGGYVPLQSITTLQDLNFTYTDNGLIHGLNIYRVRIELLDGRVVYSETVTIYFASEPYFVYPNPAPQNQDVTLISNEPAVVQLQIFNAIGAKLFEKTINNWSSLIPTGRLSKGIYLLRIMKDKQLQKTLKLIIY